MKLFWSLAAVCIIEWNAWFPPPDTRKYLWLPSHYAQAHYFLRDDGWIFDPQLYQDLSVGESFIRIKKQPFEFSWLLGTLNQGKPGCFFGRDDGSRFHPVYCRVLKLMEPAKR